jgi:hypothetical protein
MDGSTRRQLHHALHAFEAREPGDGLMRMWLLDGLRFSAKGGARASAAVVAATTAFLPSPARIDSVSRFVTELCETGNAAAAIAVPNGMYEFSSKLHAAYSEWSHAQGIAPATITTFGRRLSALGFPVRRLRRGSKKARLGLKLRA